MTDRQTVTPRLTKVGLAADLSVLEVVRFERIVMARQTKDPVHRHYQEGVADGLKMACDHLKRQWGIP